MVRFSLPLCTEFAKNQPNNILPWLAAWNWVATNFPLVVVVRGGHHVKGGRVNRAGKHRHTQFYKCDRPAEQ